MVMTMTTMLFNVLLLTMLAHSAVGLQAALAQPMLQAWQRSIAGAGAFSAATILTSPIDCIKTRAQAPGQGSRNSFRVALDMLRNEGVSSFFAGLTPALMMAPAAMVQYTLIDPLRARYPVWLAAIMCGVLCISIKCPFDRLKTLMQDDRQQRTMGALFRETLRESGPRGLWTGYTVTLFRDLPYLVLKWVVFAQAQRLLQIGPLASAIPLGTRNLLAGAAAGAVSATCVTPADVIKTRMQLANGSSTKGKDGAPQKPRTSAFGVARQILAERGVFGLFGGIGPRLARIPIYTSITLATFEAIKDAFLRMQVAGPGAAVFAAAATVVKSEL
mmetsp:Transcript_21504/g.46725  ORF Transcript_21504/g.46725 Transcript_21504/m.46725 type:complete len:331 (-) Transcript_21504:464-1456(-)